ncbi:hypothetical protein Taro_018783, partial [Colocasia esculenta]|nr:hypothetical protein [Colocasia esculenta]
PTHLHPALPRQRPYCARTGQPLGRACSVAPSTQATGPFGPPPPGRVGFHPQLPDSIFPAPPSCWTFVAAGLRRPLRSGHPGTDLAFPVATRPRPCSQTSPAANARGTRHLAVPPRSAMGTRCVSSIARTFAPDAPGSRNHPGLLLPDTIKQRLCSANPRTSAARSDFCSPADPSRINLPRSSPRYTTERMVAEDSNVIWRISEDPIWISIKNDIRELRDMFAAAIQKTDCEIDLVLDVKCEEPAQVAICEPDTTLADAYKEEMQVQSELQDLHNDQVAPQVILSETSSLVSDSTVCTKSEIDDTWDPELFSLSGLQSISYDVFTEDRPADS